MKPWKHDCAQLEAHPQLTGLVGVDEVGRGCIAGPVVAGAVWVSRGFLEKRRPPEFVKWVQDSKTLSAADRERVWSAFEKFRTDSQAIHFAWGLANVREIDQINILEATKLAMARALRRLQKDLQQPMQFSPTEVSPQPELWDFAVEENERGERCHLLVDGRPLKSFPYPHRGIIKGDQHSFAIGLASIGAKLTRDAHMVRLDHRWPGYAFGQHKGYATATHRDALVRFGSTPIHRVGFCRGILGGGCS